jgi:hypothetical protein
MVEQVSEPDLPTIMALLPSSKEFIALEATRNSSTVIGDRSGSGKESQKYALRKHSRSRSFLGRVGAGPSTGAARIMTLGSVLGQETLGARQLEGNVPKEQRPQAKWRCQTKPANNRLQVPKKKNLDFILWAMDAIKEFSLGS